MINRALSVLAVAAAVFLISCQNLPDESKVSSSRGKACELSEDTPEGTYCKYFQGKFEVAPQSELIEAGITAIQNLSETLKVSSKTPVAVYKLINAAHPSRSRMVVKYYPVTGQEVEVRFHLTGKVQYSPTAVEGVLRPEIVRIIPNGSWGVAHRGEALYARLGLVSLGMKGSCEDLEAAVGAYSRNAKLIETQDLGDVCVSELLVEPFFEVKTAENLVALDSRFTEEMGGQAWPHRIAEMSSIREEVIGFYNVSLLEIADLQRVAFESLTKPSQQ